MQSESTASEYTNAEKPVSSAQSYWRISTKPIC